MTLHILSKTKQDLKAIAEELLRQKLVSHVTIEGQQKEYMYNEKKGIASTHLYRLKGLSKSLLFKKINDCVRKNFAGKFTLLYSEPIIMMDSEQTDDMIKALLKT